MHPHVTKSLITTHSASPNVSKKTSPQNKSNPRIQSLPLWWWCRVRSLGRVKGADGGVCRRQGRCEVAWSRSGGSIWCYDGGGRRSDLWEDRARRWWVTTTRDNGGAARRAEERERQEQTSWVCCAKEREAQLDIQEIFLPRSVREWRLKLKNLRIRVGYFLKNKIKIMKVLSYYYFKI